MVLDESAQVETVGFQGGRVVGRCVCRELEIQRALEGSWNVCRGYRLDCLVETIPVSCGVDEGGVRGIAR